MLRYILTFLALYLGYRLIRGMIAGPRERPGEGDSDPRGAVMTKDPACGTYFLKSQGVSARVGGEVLYFCSEECKDRYLKERREQ